MVLMFIDLYLFATMTFGRACSRSAERKQAWFCTRLIAAFSPTFGHRIATEGISEIEFREQVSLNSQGNITPAPGEPEGIAIVGIVVGFCVPFCITLLGHRDICLATRHELYLLELYSPNNHGIVALPGTKQHIGIEHIASRRLTLLGTIQFISIWAFTGNAYQSD